MPRLSAEVRVFLSSTFVDLRELRADVVRRLREIFGANLITMQSFGSDEAEAKIFSIRQGYVWPARSDFFHFAIVNTKASYRFLPVRHSPCQRWTGTGL
jgi:hypothetical protein